MAFNFLITIYLCTQAWFICTFDETMPSSSQCDEWIDEGGRGCVCACQILIALRLLLSKSLLFFFFPFAFCHRQLNSRTFRCQPVLSFLTATAQTMMHSHCRGKMMNSQPQGPPDSKLFFCRSIKPSSASIFDGGKDEILEKQKLGRKHFLSFFQAAGFDKM